MPEGLETVELVLEKGRESAESARASYYKNGVGLHPIPFLFAYK